SVACISAGSWHLRIRVPGRATHSGNRWLAIRPENTGDDVGVNALEKAIVVVGVLQRLESNWRTEKAHELFSPGFFSLCPGFMHADAGFPIPFYFPAEAQLEYSIMYPPDADAHEIAAEIENYVLAE